VDVDRLVEPDHPVRAIWALVGRLDLSPFRADIGSVKGTAGRPAFDPQLLISLWIYAYSEGVSSAREVERRCSYHPAYQWLTGLQAVNYHTLSDFRVAYAKGLDDLFSQVLGVLSAEGLITLERVMHDGTKVKALASSQSFHREETLRTHLEAARQQVEKMGDPRQESVNPSPVAARERAARERAAREKVERLEQALEEMKKVQAAPYADTDPTQQRVSETDPEARNMRQGDGGHAPSHNVQISTDAAHTIIVGVGVTQAGSDQGQLLPALEQIERNVGKRPQQVVADGGFTTRETILGLEGQGVDYVGGAWGQKEASGPGERRTDGRLGAEAFTYDAATDTYTCPQGQKLTYQGEKHDRVGVTRHLYQARASDCAGCPLRAQCCRGRSGRTIVRSENVPVVAAFVAKMQTEAAQQIYRQRGAVAEFPNLWLKAKLGLRQFCVRGLQKARLEAVWACLTYNIQQWIRLCWRVQAVEATT
jgi:transposase